MNENRKKRKNWQIYTNKLKEKARRRRRWEDIYSHYRVQNAVKPPNYANSRQRKCVRVWDRGSEKFGGEKGRKNERQISEKQTHRRTAIGTER